ncbi:MAG: hypothetical protein VR73_09570 [Gammaproteobacteria bacterium BRH_c0]|nr:MAG: hypothetical protein VR73_09570 [Gammaproteobacteria bacterium BRH_c0]
MIQATALLTRLAVTAAAVLMLASPFAAAGDTVLIDVRTPEEFATGHLPGALNMPYEDIVRLTAEAGIGRDTPLALYCRSGRRSGIATSELLANGFTQIENLGGYEALAKDRGSCTASNC